MQKVSAFFDNEIQQMQKDETTDNTMFVADKFNDVLMFVVHVLDIKKDLEKTIEALQKDLILVKGYRRNFVNIMNEIDKRIHTDKGLDEKSLMTRDIEYNFGGFLQRFYIGLVVGFIGLIVGT